VIHPGRRLLRLQPRRRRVAQQPRQQRRRIHRHRAAQRLAAVQVAARARRGVPFPILTAPALRALRAQQLERLARCGLRARSRSRERSSNAAPGRKNESSAAAASPAAAAACAAASVAPALSSTVFAPGRSPCIVMPAAVSSSWTQGFALKCCPLFSRRSCAFCRSIAAKPSTYR